MMKYIARLFPYNWTSQNWKYPQTWPIVLKIFPRWNKKFKKQGIYKRNLGLQVVQSICNSITGHEMSKTEWGYDGGRFVDRSCRWCDQHFKVPIEEEEVPEELKKYIQFKK